MNTTAKGQAAETQAAAYLQAKGYTLLARNFRTAYGEIDLVMRREKCLVFVEVKKRNSQAFGGPVAAVTPAKQKRIAGAAAYFIKTHPALTYDQIRFDIISILPGQTEHLQHAFVPPRTTL